MWHCKARDFAWRHCPPPLWMMRILKSSIILVVYSECKQFGRSDSTAHQITNCNRLSWLWIVLWNMTQKRPPKSAQNVVYLLRSSGSPSEMKQKRYPRWCTCTFSYKCTPTSWKTEINLRKCSDGNTAWTWPTNIADNLQLFIVAYISTDLFSEYYGVGEITILFFERCHFRFTAETKFFLTTMVV